MSVEGDASRSVDPPIDLGDSPISDLGEDIHRDENLPDPQRKTQAESTARQATARAEEAENRNKLRTRLFWVIVALLLISYVSTSLMMWQYLRAVKFIPDRVIMTAWISASIAQLIGLTLVMTRYLFPPR